ncbi:MAG: DUF3305 domain-containing protein [Alphaproteobacteria bacterium]|nr:MAG: DUF3305 domain-containing protein [Alphaproteobacteria bacterium]
MTAHESLLLGIVVERRRIDHPWKDYTWRAVAVVPGAPPRDPHDEWVVMREGDGWVRFLAGTLPLSLSRGETEGYKLALSQEPPVVYVVLRPDDDFADDREIVPIRVTANPYDAQEYLDGGEDIVEPVPMPPEVIAFVDSYVTRYHVDVPFVKFKRKSKHAGLVEAAKAPVSHEEPRSGPRGTGRTRGTGRNGGGGDDHG